MMKRKKNNSDSPEWRLKRKRILRRDQYLDQYLLKQTGQVIPATVVHHIFPKEIYPQYEFADWNLISVSDRTHRYILHNQNGELTKKGKALMLETGYKNGVKLRMKILVIGDAGTGKSTYVKQNLADGVAYDLDYIAGAFRLKGPHEEHHVASRRLAGRMMRAFSEVAPELNGMVFIIRSHPSTEDLTNIMPDKLVVCHVHHDISNRKDYSNQEEIRNENAIQNAIDFAKKNNIEVEYYPPHV